MAPDSSPRQQRAGLTSPTRLLPHFHSSPFSVSGRRSISVASGAQSPLEFLTSPVTSVLSLTSFDSIFQPVRLWGCVEYKLLWLGTDSLRSRRSTPTGVSQQPMPPMRLLHHWSLSAANVSAGVPAAFPSFASPHGDFNSRRSSTSSFYLQSSAHDDFITRPLAPSSSLSHYIGPFELRGCRWPL
jgi:hypothetical protein